MPRLPVIAASVAVVPTEVSRIRPTSGKPSNSARSRVFLQSKILVSTQGNTWLSDVLEESPWQHRQAEFDVKNNEEHAEKAAPDAHFEKLAGVSHDGRREEKGFRDLDQFFTKGHIFENRPIRKPTELLEQCAADEECLVSVDNPTADAAEIV